MAQEFERSYPGSTNLLPISEHGGTGNRGRLSDRRGLRDGGEEEGKDDEGDGDGMDISGIMVLNMEKEFSSREVPVMLRYLLNQNTILSEKVRVLSSYIEKIGKGGGEDR